MDNKITQVTLRVINELYHNGDPDKAALANLRRTLSITDKDAEKIWPLIFQAVGKNNQHLLSTSNIPSRFEIAIYTALHCYAMFQQGSDAFVFGRIPYKKEDQLNENEQVEEKGVSLFTALKQIKDNDDKIKTALDRRVTALLATTNAASAINSINHLVNILKEKNLVKKVDFAQLAADLYSFQYSSQQARAVALKWGRDYYWNVYKLETTDKD